MKEGAFSETDIILFKAISAMSSDEWPPLLDVNTDTVPKLPLLEAGNVTPGPYGRGRSDTGL